MGDKKAQRYRVLVGMDYLDKRREPGDVVDDIPEQSVKWLLRDGHIEPAHAKNVPRGDKSPGGDA